MYQPIMLTKTTSSAQLHRSRGGKNRIPLIAGVHPVAPIMVCICEA